ncbi:MAG: hypothetical protein RL637_312 [Pseudomonadota bacterium]|jgi:general secretion pathway protein I
MRSSSGFSLIEVLIALAIIASSMTILWQLFVSANHRFHQAKFYAQRLLAEQQLYQNFTEINPRLQSQGQGIIEQFHYRWHSEKRSKDYPIYADEQLIKTIALYQIKIELYSEIVTPFFIEWQQIGWQKP